MIPALIGGTLLPVVLVIPAALAPNNGQERPTQLLVLLSFWLACFLGVAILRGWEGVGKLRFLIALYPIFALAYWWLIGSKMPFGDEQPLRHLADLASTCWSDGNLFNNCFKESGPDTRYAASSVYHGLRLFLYGDSQIMTISWGGTILLSAALIALPGLILSGLTNVQAFVVFGGILVWPDFLDMTPWMGRDILILWAILAWYSGIRYTVSIGGIWGIIPASLGVALLAYSRPAYLPICALDLVVLIALSNRAKLRRSSAVLTGIAIFATAVALVLIARSNDPALAAVHQTSATQASLVSQDISTTASTNIGGNLATLTGIGLLVSIPVRLVIAILAPFPWTSTELFYMPVGGFNGSGMALASHIVKSTIALSAIVFLSIRLWHTYKRRGAKGIFANTNLPICAALLLSACLAVAGFNRYVAISFPFVAATICSSLKVPQTAKRLRGQVYRAGVIAVAGIMCVLAIYGLKS